VIVLDTNALVFWTLDRDKLTHAAMTAIEEEEHRVISSISIWEIGLKVKRETLVLPLPVSDYVERLKRVEGLRILPVDDRTWLRNVELDWSHRDPADRTIVATAMLDSSPLVTSDATIRSFYQRAIW
jgi:PIN domain nuclease of toxin-antitoxin system